MLRDEEFAIQQALGSTKRFIVSCRDHFSHEVLNLCKLKQYKHDSYFVSMTIEAMDCNDAITEVLRKKDLPEKLRQYLTVHQIKRK